VAGDVACHVAGDVARDMACREIGDLAQVGPWRQLVGPRRGDLLVGSSRHIIVVGPPSGTQEPCPRGGTLHKRSMTI